MNVTLGNQVVGDGRPVFFLAEIGINHNGDLSIAKRLIDAAFACRWDCVKFQKRTPELCVPEHQKNVPRETPWGRMTYFEYRQRVEFGRAEYDTIEAYCRQKPTGWTASVWDVPSLEFLLNYDIPFVKIPSAKLTDEALLTAAARCGKPLLVSTGMSSLEELDRAVALLQSHCRDRFILLHTNSAYPAPHDQLNLRLIPCLRQRYECLVGYSGHEYDLEPTVVAVALGACLVERHVTLDHEMWGSDHAASLEVHAMDLLRKRVRDVNAMLGDGVKRLTPSEEAARRKLRGN